MCSFRALMYRMFPLFPSCRGYINAFSSCLLWGTRNYLSDLCCWLIHHAAHLKDKTQHFRKRPKMYSYISHCAELRKYGVQKIMQTFLRTLSFFQGKLITFYINFVWEHHSVVLDKCRFSILFNWFCLFNSKY